MKFSFKQGYISYGNDNADIVIVAPHSGPAMDNPTSRDDNSETVAGLCWKKTNSRLIISTIPRRRFWGIDFNRDIPPKQIAFTSYPIFEQAENLDYISHYMKKYAWVAKDEQDYENRLRIYQSFWAEVEKGKKIILIHKAFNRVRSIPSIIDFITFKNKGIKQSKIKKIIKNLNREYRFFFKSIEKSYKEEIINETKKRIFNIIRTYGSFNITALNQATTESLRKDLNKIEKYAKPYIVRRLKENFTPNNYMKSVTDALKKAPKPEITIENVADGSLALGPDRKLFPTRNKTIIEVEPTHFMNFWYPNTTSEIICKVIKEIN